MAPKRKGSSKSASMDQDPPSDAESDASSSGSSAPSLIDVDFDFFAPNADVDLIALKRLLRQLLHTDSDLFDLHTVGETVLAACERDGVGSCIKVDGEESDPFSFLSVLNLNVLKDDKTIRPLLEYLIRQSSSNSALHKLLSTITSSVPSPESPQIGLVLSERLINMPVQTQPPLYRMLGEEMAAARSNSKPYAFTHYLLLSKLYVSPTASFLAASRAKQSGKKSKQKSKKAKGGSGNSMQVDGEEEVGQPGGILPFHPEDSLLERHALHKMTYPFRNAASRDANDDMEFGLDQRAGLMLFEASKWPEMIKTLEDGCV